MTGNKATELKKIEPGYNSQAIELLENLLGRAKKGEIVEVLAFYKRQGTTSWDHDWTGCDDIIKFVGYLEMIKARQIKRAHE